MVVGSYCFLCSPNCPKQPRTSFLFYNYFIKSSLVGSLLQLHSGNGVFGNICLSLSAGQHQEVKIAATHAFSISHFYFHINFGDRLYSKEKRPGSPLLLWIQSVAKFYTKVKVTAWIWHHYLVTISNALVHSSAQFPSAIGWRKKMWQL